MSNAAQSNSPLIWLRRLLQPIALFALRHGINIQDLIECCKVVLLETARAEMERKGTSVTQSRLAVMTGLHRRDVTRLAETPVGKQSNETVITRVIGLWQGNSRFLTASGDPRVLTIGTVDSDFSHLVSQVSTDINPATILFELERLEIVKRTKTGLRLVKEGYLPTHDIDEAMSIVCRDSLDLYLAVEENVYSDEDIPNLHRRTYYDNITPAELPRIKRWLMERGIAFHREAREFLSQYDRDINPQQNFRSKGAKVVLGTFSKVYN